ncbi:hypothetical protein ZWY2020_054427 [Hordeum vulgare]|nr:hypothetical protein ZWY2020_054427 [Hordeum vulgare]
MNDGDGGGGSAKTSRSSDSRREELRRNLDDVAGLTSLFLKSQQQRWCSSSSSCCHGLAPHPSPSASRGLGLRRSTRPQRRRALPHLRAVAGDYRPRRWRLLPGHALARASH